MHRALPILLAGLVLLLAGGPVPAVEASGDVPGVSADSTVYHGIHWRTEPPLPCVDQPVSIAFEFCRCNVTVLRGGLDPAGLVRLHARIDHSIVCVQCDPGTFFVPLGRLAAGPHVVTIEIDADIIEPDGSQRTEVTRRPFAFVVRPDCGPPPGDLPYVNSIRIGRGSSCLDCPQIACPGDSIPVVAAGEVPDDCVRFAGLELLPSPIMGPLPEPPVLRILFETNSCLGRPCVMTPYPWRDAVKLPSLPPRDYFLMVEVAQYDACTRTIEIIGRANLPFAVVDSCGPIPPPPPADACFITRFAGATPGESCDAFLGPERPAELTLEIASGVALAGLQGKLLFYPSGLQVTGLEAVGPAQGMRLEWKPTEAGASFVLFADSGAPIPGDVRCLTSFDVRCLAPILRVTVAAVPGLPAPARTEIYTSELLGSDSTGVAVHPCPGVLTEAAVLEGATICRAAPCDVNGDGLADVRDLVLMVHCILETGPCPDPMPPDLDCDHDQALDIDDVLCCARTILRGETPPDTADGRPEPSVAVRLGEAVRTADGVDVPITVVGADRLGAARLELTYPEARFTVAGVDLGSGAASWLDLHEAQGGRLVVGLIDLAGPQEGLTSRLDLVARLALKPGQRPGGALALASGQFSGPDGAALAVDLGLQSLTLAAPVTVQLSPGRPNPFASQTRFTVMLSAPADLDVAVYDLQGRKVAGLYRGAAPAGETELTWDRTRGDGTAVPTGIYFYRATADGVTATRKLMVMPRE